MAMYDLLRATRVPNFDPLPVITLIVAPPLEIHVEQHNGSLICVSVNTFVVMGAM